MKMIRFGFFIKKINVGFSFLSPYPIGAPRNDLQLSTISIRNPI